jgi:hypothetical protein
METTKAFLLGALALLGCSRSQSPAADGSAPTASPAISPAIGSAVAGKSFGEHCLEDGECAAAVCFHKRLKSANAAPERRGASDPVERDGYCSMSCKSDEDCPVPPTSGRCGARGMCKRIEAGGT